MEQKVQCQRRLWIRNRNSLQREHTKMCIYSFQATDEIQRLRRQVSQARSPSPSRAASAVLLRVESERDAALADLRRTNTQLDNLEDKLKVCSYVENEESLKFISVGIKMQ